MTFSEFERVLNHCPHFTNFWLFLRVGEFLLFVLLTSMNKAWFGELNMHPAHYEKHRYYDLNLNNIWRTGTIEVRAANGSTHAGEIKANLILCLAIAAKALTAKSASSRNRREYDTRSAKYDMRVFLVCGLGLNGDEFKNVRMHLLKRLPGCAAWKNGERAA